MYSAHACPKMAGVQEWCTVNKMIKRVSKSPTLTIASSLPTFKTEYREWMK